MLVKACLHFFTKRFEFVCVSFVKGAEDGIGIFGIKFSDVVSLSGIFLAIEIAEIGGKIEIVTEISVSSRFGIGESCEDFPRVFFGDSRKFKGNKIFGAEVCHCRECGIDVGIGFHGNGIVKRVFAAYLVAYDQTSRINGVFRSKHIVPHQFDSEGIVAELIVAQSVILREECYVAFRDG